MVAEIEVHRLKIPIAAVRSLSPAERYAYYLLGHIFNELMFLQKLLKFALPIHDDERSFRKQPEMAQALCLFRIAAGKMFEAKLALENPTMSQVLPVSFLLLAPGLSDRLEKLRFQVEHAEWLKNLRNQHSFHYPKFYQWATLIDPSPDWADDDIFLAEQSGNVFYVGSDMLAQQWMFGQFDSENPAEAVEPMIKALIALIGDINGFLEDVLGAFIAQRLTGEIQQDSFVGTIECPEFETFNIPFWTHMPISSD